MSKINYQFLPWRQAADVAGVDADELRQAAFAGHVVCFFKPDLIVAIETRTNAVMKSVRGTDGTKQCSLCGDRVPHAYIDDAGAPWCGRCLPAFLGSISQRFLTNEAFRQRLAAASGLQAPPE